MYEPETPRLRPRFKGIENFLRRIAFNLGNTPSQTEVKIISCIPIDVTDLQNKIVELERELDVSGGTHQATVGAALGAPVFRPAPTHAPTHIPAHTSTHGPEHAPAHTPTHTPAHTPTHTPTHTPAHTPTHEHTVTHAPTYATAQAVAHAPEHAPTYAPAHPPAPAPAHTLTYTPTYVTAHAVTHAPTQTSAPTSSTTPATVSTATTAPPPPLPVDHYKYARLVASLANKSSSSTSNKNSCKNVIKSTNRNTKSHHSRTERSSRKKTRAKREDHLIYYAETSGSPFWKDRVAVPKTNAGANLGVAASERRRLVSPLKDVNVTWHQYRSVAPSSSHFSWPVCRDEAPTVPPPPTTLPLPSATPLPPPVRPPPPDFDECLCCHGRFHDLDHMRAGQPASEHDYSMYYDSSLYDLVPVKDTPHRMIKDDVYCCDRRRDVGAERDRSSRKQSLLDHPPPQLLVYNVAIPPARTGSKLHQKRKSLPTKSALKREQVLRTMQLQKFEHRLWAEPSRTSCVEFGELYVKRSSGRSPQLAELSAPAPSRLRDAECVTSTLLEHAAASVSVQLEPPPLDHTKTEITLNQIKSILHAVLTEVKSNAQKLAPEDKDRKDAVVQKGPSMTDIPINLVNAKTNVNTTHDNINPCALYCSQLPNCSPSRARVPGPRPPVIVPSTLNMGREGVAQTTTTPTAANPLYTTTVQHYPLFIQTSGRQCSCCYRSIPAPVPRVPSLAVGAARTHATTASVERPANTAGYSDNLNRETNSLIRDIYKSLYMNYNQSDTTNEEDNLKCFRAPNNSSSSRKKFEFKFKKRPKTETSSSRTTSSTVGESEVQIMSAPEEGNSGPAHRGRLHSFTTTTYRSEVGARSPPKLTTGLSISKARGAPEARRSVRIRRTEDARREMGTSSGARSYTTTEASSDRDSSPVSARLAAHVQVSSGMVTSSRSNDDSDALTLTPSYTETTTFKQQKLEEKKQGFFSKMKKLFTPKQRRRQTESSSEPPSQEPEPSSDSDYETVSSERPTSDRSRYEAPQVTPPRARRRRSGHSRHSRRASARLNTRVHTARARPLSRMEQEQLRYWNERLAYHISPPPETPPPQRARRPSYWREYDARRLSVELDKARRRPERKPDQVSNWGQTEPTMMPIRIPEAPAQPRRRKGVGFTWLRRAIPITNGFQCGVPWKEFLLNN